MPAAKTVKTSDCPDCGARLSQGVCPACALGFLSAPAVVPTVGVKDADLEMEFGRYLLKRKLAAGGMGVVYVAEDTQLKRQVALKMIRGSTFANDAERARFTVESEAVAGLDHPNIVPIYEIGLIDEQPFFTMKFIDGASLSLRLKDGGVGMRQVAAWICQIARAVEHAHRRGVLHRDLKPGNILIDEQDNAWLMDFGLAKLQNEESGLTRSSDHLGTPHYMPPEIVNGGASDVSTSADVWSLGVILWEAMCGKVPFTGSGAVEIMRKIAEEEPARVDLTVDRDLLTLAQRCLEKDPSRRVATAGDVAEELDRWLRGEALHVRRITPAERLWKWVRRKPVLAALYIAMAVGAISTFVLWRHAERTVEDLSFANDQYSQALAISTSIKLAMEARVQVDEDPALALLLAVESIEQTERRNGGILPESADALQAVLKQVGGLDISPGGSLVEPPDEGFIVHGLTRSIPPSYSGDGRWMLNVGHAAADRANGVVAAIYDLSETGTRTASRSWKMWDKLHSCPQVCWSPETQTLVAFGDRDELRIWDLSTEAVKGRSIGTLKVEGFLICSVFMRMLEKDRVVRGIAIYDGDGEPEPHGIYRTFRIDLETAHLTLGEVSINRAIRDEETSYYVTSELDWLLSGSKARVTLTKLGPEGEPLDTVDYQMKGWPHHPEFDVGGSWLVFGREGMEPVAFDLRSGSAKLAVDSARTMVGGGLGAQAFAISPTEPLALVVGIDREVKVIDLEGRKPRRILRLPTVKPLGVCFSPDGRWAAAGGADRVVSAWPLDNLDESPEAIEYRGMSTAILDISFAPGGRSIVAEGLGSTFRHWWCGDIKGGAQPEFVGPKSGTIVDIATSTDGRWIASGRASPGSVRLADARGSGELIFSGHAENATGVAFSPDEQWFASTGCDGFVRVWGMDSLEVAPGETSQMPKPQHEFDITMDRLQYSRRVAFHPRGTLYVSSGDGFLYEWDLNAENPKGTFKEYLVHSRQYLLPDLRISPDGKWLAIARHGWDNEPIEGSTQRSNMVLLFDVSQPGAPVPVIEFAANFGDTTNIDFSPDSRWMAAGGAGLGATVWDLSASDIAASRVDSKFFTQRMAGIAFCPDGKWLAVAGSDGRIRLWDWRNRRATRTNLTNQWRESLAWLNESQLVSGGVGGVVEIWETDLGELKKTARTIAGRELTPADRVRFRIPGN